MKTLAEVAREDKKIQQHVFKSYNITPEHAKNKRLQEMAAESFRTPGKPVDICRNARRQRHERAKNCL